MYHAYEYMESKEGMGEWYNEKIFTKSEFWNRHEKKREEFENYLERIFQVEGSQE